MRGILAGVLTIVRAVGFLAPVAVAALVTIALAGYVQAAPEQRPLLAIVLAIATVAGMTTMALVAWSYVGWRLNRIASALERTLETDDPVVLKVGGIPAERRLARAFNAASGAFLQT